MQVGDAIWQLHGVAEYLRKNNAALASFMDDRLACINAGLSFPAPDAATLTQISSALETMLLASSGCAAGGQSKKKRSAYSDPKLIEAAAKLVSEMIESGQFEWAGLVTSISEQLGKEEAFITPKQCRALKNTAAGRKYGDDEGTFWEWFCGEWTEYSNVIDKSAESA